LIGRPGPGNGAGRETGFTCPGRDRRGHPGAAPILTEVGL